VFNRQISTKANTDIIGDAQPAQNSFCSVLQSTMSNYLVRYHPATHPQTETWVRRRKGKSKAIPLQAWTDPESSRRLRLPDFRTVGT